MASPREKIEQEKHQFNKKFGWQKGGYPPFLLAQQSTPNSDPILSPGPTTDRAFFWELVWENTGFRLESPASSLPARAIRLLAKTSENTVQFTDTKGDVGGK